MPEQPADPLHYEMKIPPEPKRKDSEKPSSGDDPPNADTENDGPQSERPSPGAKP